MRLLRWFFGGLLMATGLYSAPLEVSTTVPFEAALQNLGSQPRSRRWDDGNKTTWVRLTYDQLQQLRVRILALGRRGAASMSFVYRYTLVPTTDGVTTSIKVIPRPTLWGVFSCFIFVAAFGEFATLGIRGLYRGHILGLAFLAVPVGVALLGASAMRSDRAELPRIVRTLVEQPETLGE